MIHSEPSAGTSRDQRVDRDPVRLLGPKLVERPGPGRRPALRSGAADRGRGLVPSVSEEESSQPVGKVIRQAPDAGERVSQGSTVEIVVSSGKSKAEVPNVIGKLRSEAVKTLREAGLGPVVEEEETPVPGQVGRVLDQFPPPEPSSNPGAEVTIVVGAKRRKLPEEKKKSRSDRGV